jgi:hypothetical protein
VFERDQEPEGVGQVSEGGEGVASQVQQGQVAHGLGEGGQRGADQVEGGAQALQAGHEGQRGQGGDEVAGKVEFAQRRQKGQLGDVAALEAVRISKKLRRKLKKEEEVGYLLEDRLREVRLIR